MAFNELERFMGKVQERIFVRPPWERFMRIHEQVKHAQYPNRSVIFPIVRRKDDAQHRHYRTRETILSIYDALADAMRTGQP